MRVEPDLVSFPLEELEEEYQHFNRAYAPPPDDDAPTDVAYNAAFWAHAEYCHELGSLLADTLKEEIDPANVLSFCSTPCRVGNHLVSLVLLLTRAEYDKLPQLSEEVAYLKRGYHPSFLRAVIDAYLQQYSAQLMMRAQVVSDILRGHNTRELLRGAGANFTYYAAYAGRGTDPTEILKKGPYELFEACNVISSMRYEGAEGIGRMVVSERGHPAITVQVEFSQAIDVGEYRKVRKVLEMCNEKTWVLSADRQIYGLGAVDYATYKGSKENLFEIRFVKHHSWELVHDDLTLMVTTYNEPRLPLPKFDEDDLRAKLWRWVAGVTNESVETIVAKGRTASRAKHGTTLIISSKALREADRLKSQGFPVIPFDIDSPRMGSAMSIDGGMLLDAAGICHGVGVIMDGKATPKGDSARGSRYNSAVRYVEEQRDAVVLVVSEDGMVDVVAPVEESEPANQQAEQLLAEADIRLAAHYLYEKRKPADDPFRNWLAAERGLIFRKRRRVAPEE